MTTAMRMDAATATVGGATSVSAKTRGRPMPDEIDREIGVRIRHRRLTLGLTQQVFAERLGVTPQQVHKYEKGINRITSSRLVLIVEALGTTVGDLFDRIGEQPVPFLASDRELIALTTAYSALPRKHRDLVRVLMRGLV